MTPTPSLLSQDDPQAVRDVLRDYYGKHLQSSADLSQKACCTDDIQARFRPIMSALPDEVVARHYGCGCPVPLDDLEGLTALDLGSGAGVDVFVLSKLVGPSGHVHGVDMTAEQLEVARRNAPVVAERFGFARPNVTFHEGYIETCDAIADASIDLVISDCVVNLSPRKDLVLGAIRRVLKEGGEFYISDIVADRRVPERIANDPEMIAECLGGALYEHDFMDAIKDAGFLDPRVVERKVLQTEALGIPIVFSSVTVRAQKFSRPLDRRCEDYGQTATYLGTFSGCPARYVYDDHHVFERGRPTPVCRNTARMLSETRLAKGFQVSAPLQHFGLFDCSPRPGGALLAASFQLANPAPQAAPAKAGGCC
ncbi:MAG: methyltransferase domain-containing protein [Planctomycetes bacterium]|nr:methyltransferase domain-containing protein [Planctomycetota bacterium]